MNTKAPQHAPNTVPQAAATSSPQPSARGATAQAARRRPDEEASAKAAERTAALVNGQTPAPSADDAEFGSQQSDDAVTMAGQAVDQSAAEPVMESPSAGAPSAEAGFAASSDSAAMAEDTRGSSSMTRSMANSMAASGAASPSLSPLVWIGAPLGVVGAIAAAGGGSSSGGSSGGKPPAGTNPDASATPGGQPGEPSQAGDPSQTGNPSPPGNSPQPGDPSQPSAPSSPGGDQAALDQPPPRLMASPSNGDRPLGIQGHIQLDVRPDCTWQYSTDGGVTWQKGRGASLPSNLIGEGQHGLSFVQVDALGRVGEPVNVSVTVDLQAPGQLGLTIFNDNRYVEFDYFKADSHIEVLGLEQEASWEFSLDAGNTWRKGEGVEIPVGVIDEGSCTIQVVQIDAAGNRSDVRQRDATKDTVIEDPTLVVSGGVQVDGQIVVNSSGMILVESVEAGGRCGFRLNDGIWFGGAVRSLDVGHFSEGVNKLEVYSGDMAGNKSSTVTLNITKDTTAAAPILSAIDAIGTFNGGEILDESGAVGVSGLESGATWEYSLNGGDWVKGTGTSLPASTLTKNFNTIRIVQIDAVQNRSDEATIKIARSFDESVFTAAWDAGATIDEGSPAATLLAAPEQQTDALGALHANLQGAEAALHTASLDPLLMPPAAGTSAVI